MCAIQLCRHSLHADHAIWTVWRFDVFVVQKIVEVMTLQNIITYVGVFPLSKSHMDHVNHGT